jgi:Ca-activated chloride channel homolog
MPSVHRRAARLVAIFIAAVNIVLAVTVLAAISRAETTDGASTSGLVRPGEMGTGSILFKSTTQGLYVPAPLLATNADIQVSGTIARATVTQRFKNVSDKWVEGVYVFPLPENAAVDHLRLKVGDRFIEGRIEERQAAKKIYEQAKAEGKKAGLVEQERPNMFTTSVANVAPGDAIVVQIEYQQTVQRSNGRYSLRFPMVAGPRYIPAPAVVASGDGFVPQNPVPHADRITPPVAHPSSEVTNPVKLSVHLDAGFPLADVTSAYQPISLKRDGKDGARITLKDGSVPADRDFELSWTAKKGDAPNAALFHETRNGADYVLLSVTPPTDLPEIDSPREFIFVIDISGSMAGESIREAKAGLTYALGTLKPRDSFNIIAFNTGTATLFSASQLANPQSLASAKRFIDDLEADGGTEMYPALQRALEHYSDQEAGRLRQVVFLTDGAVGNEEQLFQLISQNLGQTRLFTIGIGSAPNSYFMTRAARMGRGTYTYIGSSNDVLNRMSELLGKIAHPALTDIKVNWPQDAAAEASPDPVPDLYFGEPVEVSAKLAKPDGLVTISGTLAGQAWQTSLNLGDATDSRGVAALWARNKIAALEESQIQGGDPETVKRAITATALDYGLTSKFTSLVAVDVTPSRPNGAGLTTTKVATLLPAGWQWNTLFGSDAEFEKGTGRDSGGGSGLPVEIRKTQTDDAARVQFAQLAESASIRPSPAGAPIQLPQTATPAGQMLLTGLLIILAGLLTGLAWLLWPRFANRGLHTHHLSHGWRA